MHVKKGLKILTLSHPCDCDIACMDAGTCDLSGTKITTVHPEHRHSFTSMYLDIAYMDVGTCDLSGTKNHDRSS